MPSVYLLLTRTNTMFSRAIHGATGNCYTHSSLALDRDLQNIFSFGRRIPTLMLPAGFVREHLHSGVFGHCPGAQCLVLEIPVSSEAYEYLRCQLAYMETYKNAFQYDVLGFVLLTFGIARNRPHKFVCSHFVADLLEKAGALRCPKHPSLMRPQDFTKLGLQVVYEGPLGEAAGDVRLCTA